MEEGYFQGYQNIVVEIKKTYLHRLMTQLQFNLFLLV